MQGQSGHKTQWNTQLPSSYLGIDDLSTECSFDSQDTWVIDVLALFLDISSMGVCTTRHWQTSGRLVHELNVCTVLYCITNERTREDFVKIRNKQ